MRIAFLNIFQGKVNRGAETFVSELSKELRKNNDVKVFSGNSNFIRRTPFLWRLFIDPNGLAIMKFTFSCLKQIIREKYDVVIPLNGGWQSILVRLTTWFYGGKMLVTGQSGVGWDDRVNLYCFPDAFVCLSSHSQKWAKKTNPFVKTIHIPNGVDVNKFSPKGKKYKTRLAHPIILCVAAITKEKRVELAIKAAAKLSGYSLLLVGDGDFKEEINKVGEKFLKDRFEVSSVSYELMPEIYRSADVFTLPSQSSHSFEIAIIEAMASGLGVVVTDDPIRGEIVGESGILVDPMDLNRYSESITEALKLKNSQKLMARASFYRWDFISRKYTDVFKEILR